MPILTIQQPIGGWGKDNSPSSSTAIETKSNQYSKSTSISLWRIGRLGHIGPGESWIALVDASTRVNAQPINADVASDGKTFIVLDNARLVRITSGIIDATNYYDIATSVSTSNNDILIVKDESGNEVVLVSWESSTVGDISLIKTDGTSQDVDWFSNIGGGGTLDKGVAHKMWIGPLNEIACTNGQYLATVSIDGDITSATTSNTSSLDLGVGWEAKDGVLFGNYHAIVGYKKSTYIAGFSRSQVRVWLWDGFSPRPNFIFDINDNYATSIKNDNGVLKVITQGRNNSLKVWGFTGSRFEILNESLQVGSAPETGAVEIYQRMLHWGSTSVYVLNGKSLHYRSVITDGTTSATALGMLKDLDSNGLYAGATVSGGFKVFKMDTSGYNISSDFRTRLIALPYKATITKVTPYYSQFGSGASVTFSLFKDYVTLGIGSPNDLLDTQQTNATLGAVTSAVISKSIPDVNAFYMNFRFDHTSVSDTAAIIRKVEIEYEDPRKG